MSSFKKTIILSLSFFLILLIVSGTSLGDEMGDILGGLFGSDPYPDQYQGGEYNENEYWVYIQPEDDITTPEMIKGRTQKGDIVDIIPTSRGKGGYAQSKDFLIIKVANLSEEQIARLTQRLEQDKAVKDEKGDDKIEKEQIAERKYRLDLDGLKREKDISKDKGTVPITIDASDIIPVEKSKEEISRYQEKARFYAKTQWLKSIALNIIPKAKAATTNTRYVDPDAAAGGDGTTNGLTGATCAYQSLLLWEAARNADITLATGSDAIEEVVVDSNGEAHSADTSAQFYITGWTTASGNYIYIHTPADSRHSGVWDDTKYRRIYGGGVAGSALSIREDYVRIDGLQVSTINPTANSVLNIEYTSLTAGNTENWLSNTIIKGHNSETYSQWAITPNTANINLKVWNVLAYNFNTAIANNLLVYLNQATGNVSVYNSTFIGGYSGLDAPGGTMTVKNTYAGGCGYAGRCFYRNLVLTTSAASDTTGSPDTLDSIAVDTTNFTNVTAGSEDFHLPSGSALINVGTDTSGDAEPLNFTTDIDGDTRSGTWDIGADEYVVYEGVILRDNVIFRDDILIR